MKNKPKVLLVCLMCLLMYSHITKAQTPDINSAGSSAKLSEGQVNWSIGNIQFPSSGKITNNSIASYITINEGLITAIEKDWNIDINCFPNPTIGKITFTNIQEELQLDITSIKGEKILTRKINANQNEIDLSNYPAGIYIFSLLNGNQSKSFKILKK